MNTVDNAVKDILSGAVSTQDSTQTPYVKVPEVSPEAREVFLRPAFYGTVLQCGPDRRY